MERLLLFFEYSSSPFTATIVLDGSQALDRLVLKKLIENVGRAEER
jgi:hypothetical protein